MDDPDDEVLKFETIASQHGHHYQVKLLMLAISRAYNSNVEKFRMATEFRDAGKFDDIVYQYSGDEHVGSWKLRLVQAKHRESSNRKYKEIMKHDLLSQNSDFGLKMYWTSYQDIVETCQLNSIYSPFYKSEIEEVTIITNGILNRKTDGILEESESIENDQLFKVSGVTTPVKMKISSEGATLLQTRAISNYRNLIAELADNLVNKFNSIVSDDWFLEYLCPLARDVFIVNDPSSPAHLKFRDNFIRGELPENHILAFRNDLKAEIEKLGGDLSKFNSVEIDLQNLPNRLLLATPIISDVDNYVEKFNSLLGTNNLVKIPKTFPIDFIVGHILIKWKGQIRFRTRFLLSSYKLEGDIHKFREKLKSLRGNDFENLSRYEFALPPGTKIIDESVFDKRLPQPDFVFFEKFRLIVNYPNRDQLNNVINIELRKIFEKLNVSMYNLNLESNIYKWMASRLGSFYTREETKKLFEKISNISHLTIEVFNQIFFNFSKSPVEFQVDCNFLKDFIDSVDQILNIRTSRIELSKLMMIQCFNLLRGEKEEKYSLYTYQNGYIFNYLSKLGNILFDTNNLPNIIILVCDGQYAEIPQLLWDFLQVDERKKLVLIFSDSFPNATHQIPLAVGCCSKSYGDSFFEQNLTSNSRRDVLDLFRLRHHDSETILRNVVSPEDILPSVLIEQFIVNHNVLNIGRDIPASRGFSEAYFMERSLLRVVELSVGMFKDKKFHDTVIVCTNNEISFGHTFPDIVERKDTVVVNSFQVDEKLENLCDEYGRQEAPTHVVEYVNDKFYWKYSRGLIHNLCPYRKVDEDLYDGAKVYAESEIIDLFHQHRLVIIGDIAGSGKSTVIDYLLMSQRIYRPNFWIFRINLNEFVQQFDDCVKTETPIDLMSLLGLQGDTEKWIFTKFQSKGFISLFIDGFDEICPLYTDLLLELFDKIMRETKTTLCITTRTSERIKLEQKLNEFSYSLLPFSEPKQIKLLSQYWHSHEAQAGDIRELQEYAKEVLAVLSNVISDIVKKFTGIPLQTLMVAEIFSDQNALQEFQTFSDNKEKLSLRLLYQMFFDKKYTIYANEKCGGLSNMNAKIMYSTLKPIYLKYHQEVAFYTIFSQNDCRRLSIGVDRAVWSRNDQNFEKCGIIEIAVDRKPHFLHRTFAEYFVSEFFIEQLKDLGRDDCDKARELYEFLFENILRNNEHNVIRRFFDNGLIEILPLIDQHLVQFEEIVLTSFINGWVDFGETHAFDRNHIWTAINEELYFVVKLILLCLRDQPLLLKSVINMRYRIGNIIHVDLIPPIRIKEILLILLKHGLEFTSENLFEFFFDSPATNYGYGVPCLSENCGLIPKNVDFDYFQSLFINEDSFSRALVGQDLDKIMGVLENCTFDFTKLSGDILFYAAKGSSKRIVKFLVDIGCNQRYKGVLDDTMLHSAAVNLDLDVLKYFVEEVYGDDPDKLLAIDAFGASILHYACTINSIDHIKYLIGKGLQFNLCDDNGRNSFHYLIDGNTPSSFADNKRESSIKYPINMNTFEYCVANFPNDLCHESECGDSLLHRMCHIYGNPNTISIMKILLAGGCCINEENLNGDRPIDLALYNGSLAIFQFLVENGADTCGHRDGDTLFDHAISLRNYEQDATKIIKYLLHLNFRTIYTTSLLKCAVVTKDNELFQHYFGYERDITKFKIAGMPAPEYIFRHGNLEMIKYLVERLEIEMPENALHLTINNFENFEYLWNKIYRKDKQLCKYFPISQDRLQELLHVAIKLDMPNPKLVTLLIEKCERGQLFEYASYRECHFQNHRIKRKRPEKDCVLGIIQVMKILTKFGGVFDEEFKIEIFKYIFTFGTPTDFIHFQNYFNDGRDYLLGEYGHPPIFFACERDNFKMLRYLVEEKKCDRNVVFKGSGLNLFSYCLKNDSVRCIYYLVFIDRPQKKNDYSSIKNTTFVEFGQSWWGMKG